MTKYCVLDETKICDNCGKCNVCDLDPNKICDNCMKCLQTGADYNAIEIDEIIEDGASGDVYRQLREDLAEDGGERPLKRFEPKQYTPKAKK
ncbi:MAG: hypothetical protein IKE76_14745 [Clostridia bacterium]|nr:hypothetical protein [Clostridia bacterium]